jgi:hypothetical protein
MPTSVRNSVPLSEIPVIKNISSFIGQKSWVPRDMPDTRSPPMKQMERREWWLWSFVVIITLLLTAGIASFALPLLRSETDSSYRVNIQQSLRGLLGLVLLFDLLRVPAVSDPSHPSPVDVAR